MTLKGNENVEIIFMILMIYYLDSKIMNLLYIMIKVE